MDMTSNNRILLMGCLRNYTDFPLRNISVIADAYDESKRIIGTGMLVQGPAVTISPSDTLLYTIEIAMPGGSDTVKSIMIIPRSHIGTGKPTIVVLKDRQ